MVDEDLPSLEESDIQSLATSKVFARGRVLFDEGALEELNRRGAQLAALCQGSDEEPYELSVRIGTGSVEEPLCSCLYEYEGLCKHLVALLLAWAHTPEAFEEIEENSTVESESALLRELRGCERDELARLIVQLVETEPKLRAIVRRSLQPRLSESDVDKTRRAVESLLRKILRSDYEPDFRRLRRDLEFHLRGAAALEALRPVEAGRLYAAILSGLMAAGEEPFSWDEEGELSDVSGHCAAALNRLLPDAPAARRGEWLEVLSAAYLFDVQMGGMGFADEAEAALESATDEEWERIEPQLDSALEPAPAPPRTARAISSGGGWSEVAIPARSTWAHSHLIELKVRRLQRAGKQQAATRLLLEQGTPEQQVDAHLAAGDFEEATRLAERHFAAYAGLIRAFADKLANAGQWQRAREWALRHGLMEWLAQQSARRGDPEAFNLNLDLFRTLPTVERWFQLMELAPESKRTALRTELWKVLEGRRAYALQFDIKLRQIEMGAALEIWSRLNRQEKQCRHEVLARAAECSRGDIAIKLWSELAESLIAQRSRDAYSVAARALARAKKLLEQEGRGHEWPARSADIRARYPTLRALKEEMERAKV